MIGREKTKIPELFQKLEDMGCIREERILGSGDGFCAAVVPLSEILSRRGISSLPGSSGRELDCGLYFDDWYLYALPKGEGHIYSLFKMREQEYDAAMGRDADGDIPGVTVPFIALSEDKLLNCLHEPTESNRRRLNEEINRVVAAGGQRHDETLKRYFIRTEAKGAYLIAELYTGYIASLAENGALPVPEGYLDCVANGVGGDRLRRFIEENNRNADKVVCDHKRIYIQDPYKPTEHERLAILATHTGNTSYFSFAAEVQFHAKFLTHWAKIPIPFIGRSPYASAIRADMSIGDGEFVGPTPYYRDSSRIVRKQYLSHKDELQMLSMR